MNFSPLLHFFLLMIYFANQKNQMSGKKYINIIQNMFNNITFYIELRIKYKNIKRSFFLKMKWRKK